MAEDGTLADIIAQYVNLQSIIAYNNLTEMRNATNLTNGIWSSYYIKCY
jgi:hypothetical protein